MHDRAAGFKAVRADAGGTASTLPGRYRIGVPEPRPESERTGTPDRRVAETVRITHLNEG